MSHVAVYILRVECGNPATTMEDKNIVHPNQAVAVATALMGQVGWGRVFDLHDPQSLLAERTDIGTALTELLAGESWLGKKFIDRRCPMNLALDLPGYALPLHEWYYKPLFIAGRENRVNRLSKHQEAWFHAGQTHGSGSIVGFDLLAHLLGGESTKSIPKLLRKICSRSYEVPSTAMLRTCEDIFTLWHYQKHAELILPVWKEKKYFLVAWASIMPDGQGGLVVPMLDCSSGENCKPRVIWKNLTDMFDSSEPALRFTSRRNLPGWEGRGKKESAEE